MITSAKFYLSLLLLFTLVLAPSCKTKKIVSGGSTIPRRGDTLASDDKAVALIQLSRANRLDYEWLSTRIKVEYNGNNISQDFTAAVRMRRDSILWISLQGPFGIEGGRILITRDSFLFINKLSNEYVRQPISYLAKVMPMQTDMALLQDFIMGAYMLFDGAAPQYRGMEDSLQLLQAESPQFRYQSSFNPQNYTLTKSVLADKMVSQQMNITFGGYSSELGKPFSTERSIDIKKGSMAIGLHLVFTKIKVNEVQSFPFEIGSGMKQTDKIGF